VTEAFGPWDLVQPLARGGMAEVFVARRRDPPGADFVCIKRILPAFLNDPDFASMFTDEARIAQQLDHENLVRVLEAGDVDGRLFLAMELVRGTTLAEVLRARRERGAPLSLAAALAVARPLCRALAHAHALVVDGVPQEVVHRDVAPDNVLLSEDGVVKLTDFGVARARDRVARTHPGFTKGKEPWMSPEQAQGQAIDHRTDQFSLAVLLWEMVVGRPLFRVKDDVAKTLDNVVRAKVPRPSAENPALPASLDAVLLRALAQNRRSRFPDMMAFEAALAGLGVPEAEARTALADTLFDVRFNMPTTLRPAHGDTPAAVPPAPASPAPAQGGVPPWAFVVGALAAGATVGAALALAFRAFT